MIDPDIAAVRAGIGTLDDATILAAYAAATRLAERLSAPPAAGAAAETVIDDDGEGWTQTASRGADGCVYILTRRHGSLCDAVAVGPAAWSRLLEVMNGGK